MRTTSNGVDDAGTTLVELAIALAGLALVSLVMTSFFVGANAVDALHEADDAALEQLRDARQRMSRDVREARRFTSIGAFGFTVWIDEEWDAVVGSDELVTWGINSNGQLFRAVEGTGRIEAEGLVTATPAFAYDALLPSNVTRLVVHLVADVDAAGGGTRILDTEVSLRNVP